MSGSWLYKFTPLFFILVIASILRLYNFSTGYGFYQDQGQDLLAIRNWFMSGRIPLQGIETSIGGFHMGPFYYYTIAPFLHLTSGDPIGPVLLFLISGIALVALAYLLALRFGNIFLAIIFSALAGLSYHLIYLSKGAYSPNLQPLLFLALLWFLLSYLESKRMFNLFCVYLLIGIGVQFHYVFLANLLTVTLIIILVDVKNSNWKNFAICSSGFLLPLVPFLTGQIGNGFLDIRNLFHYLFQDVSLVVDQRISLMEVLSLPFSIYFSFKTIDWPWRIFFPGIVLLIIGLNFLIAFRKGSVAETTRVCLGVYFLSVIWAMVMRLKLEWWYFEYFSILSLFFVANTISFIYQYSVGRYVWLVLLAIVFWREIFLLPAAYSVSRPASLVRNVTEKIISEANKTKPVSIYLVTTLSGKAGYEYRYLLEKGGIKSLSAKDENEADYVIFENSQQVRVLKIERSKVDVGLKLM